MQARKKKMTFLLMNWKGLLSTSSSIRLVLNTYRKQITWPGGFVHESLCTAVRQLCQMQCQAHHSGSFTSTSGDPSLLLPVLQSKTPRQHFDVIRKEMQIELSVKEWPIPTLSIQYCYFEKFLGHVVKADPGEDCRALLKLAKWQDQLTARTKLSNDCKCLVIE